MELLHNALVVKLRVKSRLSGSNFVFVIVHRILIWHAHKTDTI